MEIVTQLKEWASINSYSYNSAGLEKMVAVAKEAFSILQPDEMEVLPTGLSVKKRPQTPFRIFLGGHLDTVFSPDHPFQEVTQLDANRLQGPGVADMKGGVLVMLHALRAFELSSIAKKIGWEVFLNLDEEIGSPYSTPFLRACATRCAYALLFEPPLPDGSFVNVRKGSSNYLAVSKGKEAHAGRHPDLGKNAIYPLARFVTSLEELNIGSTVVNVGTFKGGRELNTIPDYAEAGINVRSYENLDALLQERAEAAGVFLSLINKRPSKPFDSQTEQLFNLLKECGERLGHCIQWKESGGVCDGNTFGTAGVPTIDTLGVEGGGIHTQEEFIYLDSLQNKIELSTLLLTELARRAET